MHTSSQSKNFPNNRNRQVVTVMACCTLNFFCLCPNQWETQSRLVVGCRQAESLRGQEHYFSGDVEIQSFALKASLKMT